MATPPSKLRKVVIQRPKGTQDLFGDESARWEAVEALCRLQFKNAGYQEIRTPAFEHTELFERGVGEATDIVNKEMYTFEKSERRLSLRPEGTAGVVRSFIEQGMGRWPKPVKLYYMGPMFRYERPQAGRQRQFHQVGVELFGLDTPASDAEVILMAMRLFESLGLPNLSLQINNIGTAACRETFKAGLKVRVQPYLSQLCADCQTRYDSNPLRMLDCKNTACQSIYGLPDIQQFLQTDFTSEACQAHFAQLLSILDALKVPYQRNFMLVRGLDYYTKTVFEITSTNLGAQNAVCGGGRYNTLVEDLGGPETPAIGWALGLERLMSLVGALPVKPLDYYIVTDQHAAAFDLAEQLRAQHHRVEVDLSGKGFGKQLERAAKLNATQVLILGEAEAKNGEVQLKILATKAQSVVPYSQLFER
ncbi:histidine--tRNA ligase [Vampirovibrio sp.]|uniref:histidine--tRNA ligase n=1 Tax=Vampirovibrio sp. TaxID=2717857 RepID=UPI0035937490